MNLFETNVILKSNSAEVIKHLVGKHNLIEGICSEADMGAGKEEEYNAMLSPLSAASY